MKSVSHSMGVIQFIHSFIRKYKYESQLSNQNQFSFILKFIFRSRAATFACTSGNVPSGQSNTGNNSPRFKRNVLPQATGSSVGIGLNKTDHTNPVR